MVLSFSCFGFGRKGQPMLLSSVGFPSFVGLLNLLNMVLLFWPTTWLAHDSWHIQDWFEVFKERKKNYKSFVFSFGSSFWSTRRLLGYLFGSKQKSAFFFSIFWCYTIDKFVLQVGNVSSLDIWGFLRFVLGDLVYF